MMTEETLNKLFDQARNEVPETKASDIQKWIGLGVLGIILSGLLTKTKLILTLKPFIMIGSTFLAVGIGVGTVFVMSSKEAPKAALEAPKTENKTGWTQKNNRVLEEEIALEEKPDETKPEIPVGKTWSGLFSPMPFSDSFCMEPIGAVRPIAPIAPIATIRSLRTQDDNDDNQDYGYFNGLKLSGGVEVVLKQGEECGVRLEGDEEAKKTLVIKNTNKTLEIYTQYNEKKKKADGPVTVFVTVTDLSKIQCSGATRLASEGELNLTDLSINSSGASDIYLMLKVSDLKMTASGASKIVLNGYADKLTLTASGATDFLSEDLNAKQVKLDFSGASKANINVSENLDIKAAGASDIEYVGDPNTVNQNISGGSSVKHKKS